MVKCLRDIFENDEGFHLLKGRIYDVIEIDRKAKLIKVNGEKGKIWISFRDVQIIKWEGSYEYRI